jgi:hypothetical protein
VLLYALCQKASLAQRAYIHARANKGKRNAAAGILLKEKIREATLFAS